MENNVSQRFELQSVTICRLNQGRVNCLKYQCGIYLLFTMWNVCSAVKRQYRMQHRQCPCSSGVYILVLRERPSIYVSSNDCECCWEKNKSKGDVETWGSVLNRMFKESLEYQVLLLNRLLIHFMIFIWGIVWIGAGQPVMIQQVIWSSHVFKK